MMSVSTQWLLKASLLYMRFTGDVSLEDIDYSSKAAALLLEDFPQERRFQLIIDASQCHEYPRSISAIRPFLDLGVYSRIDWVVLIARDVYQQHLIQIVSQIFGMRSHISDNVQEAYRFLQKEANILLPQSLPDSLNETIPHK